MPNLTKEMAWTAFQTGAQFRVETPAQPFFKPGDTVRALNINPDHHTRLPRYVRGKIGTIELTHGVFVFADTRGSGLGDDPQHLYRVRFSAKELWGEGAPLSDSISLTLWESYMELVESTESAQ